ncbi:MAG TPA: peptidylprolyl isomerase [Chitinophagales bacterium]|nr:peptidylprolyl isomerase [Chitinophagales bacterium]
MKYLLVAILISVTTFVSSQDLSKTLKKIKTEEQAHQFVKSNSHASLSTILSVKDTSEIARTLLAKKRGDILTIGDYIYKIINSTTTSAFKVSYIYLDAGKLSLMTIDSIRGVIINKFHNGSSFADLVSQYTMDGNPTGEFGWATSDMTVKEFSSAVKAHKKGDIFTIDVVENKWYYVTLKTYDDQPTKVVTVLRVGNAG